MLRYEAGSYRSRSKFTKKIASTLFEHYICNDIKKTATVIKIDISWAMNIEWIEAIAAEWRYPLHACYRLLLARGLSIDSRAYVISLHAGWLIGTPSPTCTNQDAWVVITPKQPKANSIHTAAWQTWTPTPVHSTGKKALVYLIQFPAPFIGNRAILILGDRDMAGGCS